MGALRTLERSARLTAASMMVANLTLAMEGGCRRTGVAGSAAPRKGSE
jgi:hypothetical protein